ncbi:hypothetical protein [Candidatus Poriferisodalis sp.]|uniref:hypothetical protein n=1 Tax=Candidatus Poriferisodalis sp. TaxID=3101277 RepID=UPI003B015B51
MSAANHSHTVCTGDKTQATRQPKVNIRLFTPAFVLAVVATNLTERFTGWPWWTFSTPAAIVSVLIIA